jgi:hypothetical protein
LSPKIEPGNILRGPFWQERVRVISVKTIGGEKLRIEAVGLESSKFYNPVLNGKDIESIEIIEEKPFGFAADGEELWHLRLFLFSWFHNSLLVSQKFLSHRAHGVKGFFEQKTSPSL